jgi:hypothetical protein
LIALGLVGCEGSIGRAPGDVPPGTGGTVGTGGTGGTTQPPPGDVRADVGSVQIRQLSIAEYNNTVRDLLGTTLRPANQFQANEAAGFDTLASAGVMNSRKVADYYDAAAALSADVFANPMLRARIVTCEPAGPADTACAKNIITDFGKRAYRRPLESEEIADLVGRYQDAQGQMLDHAGALQHVVHVMLASPQFLYRIEFDRDPTSLTGHALSGYEVASRLSYTVWSSLPDDPLFELADRGDLLTSEGLVAQVDRMLADGRSSALVDNFAAQWLGSRRLSDHVADPTLFPAWNDRLKGSMQQEMGKYFDAFLHGDQTYDAFLTADFNYVDAGLAALYGMAAPTGQGLVRVENTTDHRAGFLGLAGFLTLTSRVERSAPPIRGKWVVNSLQCMTMDLPTTFTPPPLGEPMPGQTLRQVLEQHRANPACSGCHNILDPVGLSFEHFDAIGRYRETYEGGLAIDTVGNLGGTTFDGLSGLSQVISKDPEFIACAAQKLFTYGVGRTIDSGDPSAPYLDQMVDKWKAAGLSLRNLLKQLVSNDTFRFRHGSP